MPAIQTLKKKLRGIRSTQKLTKAMKTISAVKFSRLNGIYSKYTAYGKQCKKLLEKYGADLVHGIPEADGTAPAAVIVMASNKGLCGSFNTELLRFAQEELARFEQYLLIACGRKTIQYCKGKNLPIEKEYVLNDVPSYEESASLIDEVIAWRQSGKVSGVYVIYPKYVNTMKQIPTVHELFTARESDDDSQASDNRSVLDNRTALFVPDWETIVEKTAKTIFRAVFYELVLETAIGAQAATLMTMRSAYDTAAEYRIRLEGQINRMRQNAVTADVIETSTECGV